MNPPEQTEKPAWTTGRVFRYIGLVVAVVVVAVGVYGLLIFTSF